MNGTGRLRRHSRFLIHRRIAGSPRLVTLREPWRRRYAIRRRSLLLALGVAGGVDRSVETERLGSASGGWTIPRGVVRGDWVCYCAGAGIDVSFELALIERFGCRVLTIDPTDEARDNVAHVAGAEHRLTFRHVALWSTDGELRMYLAADPTHKTLSSDDLQSTGRSVMVPARSLRSLMRELGHDRIDLLKLDVEGAEYELLSQVAELGVSVLCVEMHPTRGVSGAVDAFRVLRRAGYRLVAREAGDFTFHRPE